MVNIPHTDLSVSEICLGTGAYGNRLEVNECIKQLDYFTEKFNFIDTARIYGNSESVIGKWLTERKCRDKVVIASKGAHPEVGEVWTSRMTKANIYYDLELSLKTLNTDYIDLYFLHRDDINIPVREIIDILEELRKSGKIRYYGCSNWTTGRITEAQNYAKSLGVTGFVSNQVMLSLTKANSELFKKTDMVQADKEMIEFHRNNQMSLMSYMTLAGGYFIKKLQGKEITDGTKVMYDNSHNIKVIAILEDLCKRYGYSPLELLLHYVTYQPYPAIPIASFSSINQMDETFTALSKRIKKEHMDILLEIAE